MALHADLLAQSWDLVFSNPRRPRQASLRRAVSTSYYALFHLLTQDAASVLGRGQSANVKHLIRRMCNHGEMLTVCKSWAQGNFNHDGLRSVITLPIAVELRQVASIFVELQQARHDADYDTSKPWVRLDAVSKIGSAALAMDGWSRIKATPNAKLFATCLLLGKNLRK